MEMTIIYGNIYLFRGYIGKYYLLESEIDLVTCKLLPWEKRNFRITMFVTSNVNG